MIRSIDKSKLLAQQMLPLVVLLNLWDGWLAQVEQGLLLLRQMKQLKLLLHVFNIATPSTNLSTALMSSPAPALPVNEDEPTLSTTRFAFNTSSLKSRKLLEVIFTIT